MDKVFVGPRVSKLDTGTPPERVSRVTLMVDGANAYTAGDDTGRTVEKSLPWATQAMAESVLRQLQSVTYLPFSGEDALLDPAAEIGDGVTAGGVYSVLAKADVTFDGLYSADIAAPGGDEVEDEYPYKSRAQRQSERELAKIRSSITKTAEAITLLVEKEIEGLAGKLELTASSLISEITKTNGQVSSIKQYVDDITLEVANGSESSQITLKSGSATISSKTIEMKGLVSFTGLANGTTIIDGACIKTGLISAERLNLTGAITFGDLDWNTRSTINNAASTASDALNAANSAANAADTANDQLSAWMYRGTTYIDGSKLMTGTVMASRLLGGYVGLLDSSERTVGGISIAYTSTGYGIELSSNTGGIRINASGNFWVDAYYGVFGIIDSGVVCGNNCVPYSSGRYSLGAGGLYWSDVYAENDAIITSDRNKKEDTSYDLSVYDQLFSALKPVSYRLKDGTSGRRHLGMIAQDVEAALEACGLENKDFAGFIKSPRADGGYDYALRYGEFIAMCINQIQQLKARVAELERGLAS